MTLVLAALVAFVAAVPVGALEGEFSTSSTYQQANTQYRGEIDGLYISGSMVISYPPDYEHQQDTFTAYLKARVENTQLHRYSAYYYATPASMGCTLPSTNTSAFTYTITLARYKYYIDSYTNLVYTNTIQ